MGTESGIWAGISKLGCYGVWYFLAEGSLTDDGDDDDDIRLFMLTSFMTYELS
jgi:hypothetical protein